MNMLKMCLNPKVIAGLVIVGLGVYVIAPGLLVAALPLLLLAACPLSMLLMGGAMMRGGHDSADEASQARQGSAPASTDEIVRLRDEVEVLRSRLDQREDSGAPRDGVHQR